MVPMTYSNEDATKETLAFVGAGVAAALTWFAIHFRDPAYATTAFPDSNGVRLIPGTVFFVVLFVLGRILMGGQAFQVGNRRRSPSSLDGKDFEQKKTPQETADAMARVFAGVSDEASRQEAIRDSLHSVPRIIALIPTAFYLRFGRVGPLGWGLTVFFDVLCLLWAIGLYFRPRTEYHSPVKLRGDWADRVGAFWLVACAFGPFFGWAVTEALPITQSSWRWLYGIRTFLSAVLPVLLALPLTRYIRGKSTLVSLPLMIGVTLLPFSTAIPSMQDLIEGPTVRHMQSPAPAVRDRQNPAFADRPELYLKHTDRGLR